MKKTKKDPERKIYRDYTLDEYDELTLKQQGIGAGWERGKIIAELERRAAQMKEFADCMESTKDKNIYSRYAYGLQMAVRIVEELRPYEENVGCPECEAF